VPGAVTQTDSFGKISHLSLDYGVARESSRSVKTEILNLLLDFTSVRSTTLNKLLVIGGRRFDPEVFSSAIYADTPPSTEHCEVLQTIRVRPSPRVFFCAVPAYGGSSIIFFLVFTDQIPFNLLTTEKCTC